MTLKHGLGGLVGFALLLAATVVTAGSQEPDAGPLPVPVEGAQARLLIGGVVGGSKAAVDTIYVLGGPGQISGKFETSAGHLPDAQGWIGVDLSQKTVVRWNIDSFSAANLDPVAGNAAMYCGALFTACSPTDPPQGYGNNWEEYLDWYGTAPDNTVPTTVHVLASLNSDTEPGYDFLNFQVERSTGMTDVWTHSGSTGSGGVFPVGGLAFDQTFTVAVADYFGQAHNRIRLRCVANSDGGYSDEDCRYPSRGHTQLDNLAVFFNGVQQTYDDFQPGSPVHWAVAFPPAVGNFAKVWPRLNDIDPCNGNATPQFAFIDDGVVVPGTGGSLGTTWTYGPSGHVVNGWGGLAGPAYDLDNEVWSPPLSWPAGCRGARFSFDVYRHLPLTNGIYYRWHVASSADGGVTWTPWQDAGERYYSNSAEYARVVNDVSTLLVPRCTHVRVALGVDQYGWEWGYGPDPTPAPYFDNVSLTAWRRAGPIITAREADLFQGGNFPASGTLTYVNLARNSVRLDMARNISPKAHLRNDPGDSIIVTVAPGRDGAVLTGPPRLRVRMKANPLFDPFRALPAGFTRDGGAVTGEVSGDTTYTTPGHAAIPDNWSFDLPDTGFFFPGDALHYYVEASDIVGGDLGTTRLPADTTGFSAFPGQAGYLPLRYPPSFQVWALPTLRSSTRGDQPTLLFWDDYADLSGEEEWHGALARLGFREGIDYDTYRTSAPSSGPGNGLGGRATAVQLASYRTLLYTSGDLGSITLSNGDFNADPGNDIGVLDAWLLLGGKNLFATGNDLEYDLNRSGTAAVAFRNKWLAVTHNSRDVRPLIGTQTTPPVKPIAGNAPGLNVNFVAYGGCTPLKHFNAVTAAGTGVRIAEFTTAGGLDGVYGYSALVYNAVTASTARVIWSPIDFMFWNNPPGVAGVARANLLAEILAYFGNVAGGAPTGTAGAAPALLAVRGIPNPFNPSVKIAYTLPVAGELSLRLYDVRGRLVRVLRDGRAEAGEGSVLWDGRDDTGAGCASGVYFCEAKGVGRTVVEKLTLVR